MNKSALAERKTLQGVIGFPYRWSDGQLAGEAEEILQILEEARLGEQLELQEKKLNAMAFLDQLDSHGIEVISLRDGDRLLKRSLDEVTMPALALDILYLVKKMPRLIRIDEWAILEERPERSAYKVSDPHLAFRVGRQWFSVCRW